jgi:hypothetical protein
MHDEGIIYAGSLDSGRYYERGIDTMKEMLPAIPEEIDFLDFDNYVSTMEWIITTHAKLVKIYPHGQTSYRDVYHDGNEMYSWFKQQRHTHNIYGEPTFVYDETKHFEGTVIEWRGNMVGIDRGAFTAIELRPYVAPEPTFLSDIDLDWDL